MPLEVCKLCLQVKELQRSHAIPDSVFKKISRENNGKLIKLASDEDSHVRYTSDSWWDYQLCIDCERHLNNCYESYAIQVLRGKNIEFSRGAYGLTFRNVSTDKINLFLISVLWRAANSKNPAYREVKLPDFWNETIRNNLLQKKTIPILLVTVKISRLFDSAKDKGFDLETIKNIIASPFIRRQSKGKYSFCFIFEGFFIEYLLPGLKFKNRNQRGILEPGKNIILIPFLDIFDIPEMVEIGQISYMKNLNGKSSIKD